MRNNLYNSKFMHLTSVYFQAVQRLRKEYAISLALLGLAFLSSTVMHTDYSNLIINYATLILASNFLQIYTSSINDNHPKYKKFLNECSNKIIYIATVKGLEPVINALCTSVLTTQYSKSAAYIASRFVYAQFIYEKNTLFDPTYNLSCAEAITKSLISAVSVKLFEHLVAANPAGIWAVYCLSKSYADCLAKNKFNYKESLDNLLKAESYKPIYYGLEFWMTRTSDFLISCFPILSNSLLLTTMVEALYRSAYESVVITPSSRAVIEEMSESFYTPPAPTLKNKPCLSIWR